MWTIIKIGHGESKNCVIVYREQFHDEMTARLVLSSWLPRIRAAYSTSDVIDDVQRSGVVAVIDPLLAELEPSSDGIIMKFQVAQRVGLNGFVGVC